MFRSKWIQENILHALGESFGENAIWIGIY